MPRVAVPKGETKVEFVPGIEPTEKETKRRGIKPGSVAEHTSGHCLIAQKADRHGLGADGNSVIVTNRTPEQIHATCKGAITNGVGTTWLCGCDCHDGKLYCHRCGFDHSHDPEGYDPERRRCLDASDCANKIRRDFEVLRRTDPTLRLLEECREAGAVERAEKNAEKARRRAEEAERARAAEERDGTPQEATKAPTKPGKAPQRCHEGCGGMTKGGRFMMGHDMRLKGKLFEEARGKTTRFAVDATIEILARGWSTAGIPVVTLQNAQDEYRDLGELEAIRIAVERRYA